MVCLIKNTRLYQGESNSQISLDIIKSNQVVVMYYTPAHFSELGCVQITTAVVICTHSSSLKLPGV